VLRRVILGCLLLAGVVSLAMMNAVAGALLAVCIIASPGLVAILLNRDRIHGDGQDEIT
jgi:hypothetical protein